MPTTLNMFFFSSLNSHSIVIIFTVEMELSAWRYVEKGHATIWVHKSYQEEPVAQSVVKSVKLGFWNMWAVHHVLANLRQNAQTEYFQKLSEREKSTESLWGAGWPRNLLHLSMKEIYSLMLPC